MKLSGLVASVALVGCFAETRQPPPAPPRQTNLEIDIQQALLPNGLRVVLVHDARAREVQVTMRYGVGSIDDPDGQEGVAHVVEHLMFQQRLGEQTLFAKLQSAASAFNAVTTHDATTYFERAPAASLDAMLAVEAVRLGYRCTSVTDAVFQREREVVQNERRQRSGSAALITALEEATYPVAHPYQHPTIGSEATLAKLTRDQACAFADTYYTPSNAVLVIAGSLAPDVVAASMAKFLARIPARTTAAVKHPVPAAPGGVFDGSAPLENPAMLVTWPLPEDPGESMRARLVVGQIVAVADSFVGGKVYPIQVGDTRSQQAGMLIELDETDSVDGVTKKLRELLTELPQVYRSRWLFDLSFGFGVMRQSVTAKMFRRYEDGFDRDARIASEVLAGRDARTLISSELDAVQQLTADVSAELLEENLSFDKASIVKLTPSEEATTTSDEIAAPVIHDLGQQRAAVNAEEASKPVTGADVPTPGTVVQRTLPNGMRIVLLPLTSIPTVDARIVFDAGTADEPTARRGAATVAAYGLDFDMHYLADMKALVEAGGELDRSLYLGATTFTVRGLDMHLDYLLAGLRRWVREGHYKTDAINIARRKADKESDTEDSYALREAWLAARFGTGHPYVGAGDARAFSSALTLDDAKRFRAQHYTPDHATLVIAGKFDTAIANQWIDFLFADWAPSAEHAAATSAPPSPQAASLAGTDSGAQIDLVMSLPATSGDRAAHLVAAKMLDQITDDVRHQLGATYGLSAYLDDERLASSYIARGRVESARTGEVLQFVRDHLQALRTDPAIAAAAFVTARRAVLDKLAAAPVTSAELASDVELEVEEGRDLLSAHTTANAVQKLTIEAMPAVLADLDMSHAAIELSGAQAPVDAAFAAIDRKPTRVAVTDTEAPFTTPLEAKDLQDQRLREEDYEDAITSPRVQRSFSGSLLVGYGVGQVEQRGFSGYAIAAEGGIRLQTVTVGLHLDVGQFSGTYDFSNGHIAGRDSTISDTTIGVSGYLHGEALDILWGGALLGVRWDKPDDMPAFSQVVDVTLEHTWKAGFDVGLEMGVDVLRFGHDRVALYGRLDTEIASGNTMSAFTFGLGYHR